MRMVNNIQKLLDGNKEFRKKFFEKNKTLFTELVQEGQKPKVMVIACSDSRVDPATIFNCQPGDLFVIRSMANLIPPCEDTTTYHGTSATLEFGTCFLNVEHIILLGHTQCGGIQALFNRSHLIGNNPHSFITKWMEIAQPAFDKVMKEHAHKTVEEKITLCEQYALVHSLHNLKTFSWIKERLEKQTLMVHAWHFNLTNGTLSRYNEHDYSWNTQN